MALNYSLSRATCNHKVLQRLFPLNHDRTVGVGKPVQYVLARCAEQEFLSERRDGDGCPTHFFPIDQDNDLMRPVAQQVPVKQQPKAIVCVTTIFICVCPTCAITDTLGVLRLAVKDYFNPLRLIHPTGDHPNDNRRM